MLMMTDQAPELAGSTSMHMGLPCWLCTSTASGYTSRKPPLRGSCSRLGLLLR